MLTRWARRATSAQALALRARIVLACDGLDVPSIVGVTRELRITADAVRKWRRRFLAEGLDGLVDEPRPGRPPTIAGDEVEAVVVATLEEIPKNATHWSRSSMAARSGLSKSTIGRIWRKFQLKPHLADTFKPSTDPLSGREDTGPEAGGIGVEFGLPLGLRGPHVVNRPHRLQVGRCRGLVPGPWA
ncbi:helix-turn-helix domain-containing protein [Kitasatospora sp. McL0602]|uniref:helix-turn-helix domain-containing protein n=1 Tax=Kitasatospora sp. McL0602 TaxID=3439530 RepID=UPI003F89490D